jgi:hypothetical protein
VLVPSQGRPWEGELRGLVKEAEEYEYSSASDYCFSKKGHIIVDDWDYEN